MFCTFSTQLGRALQPVFIISRNRSAVVEGSMATSLSSGGGGAAAVLQSEMISATDGDPSRARSRVLPTAAGKRDSTALFLIFMALFLTLWSPPMVVQRLPSDWVRL